MNQHRRSRSSNACRLVSSIAFAVLMALIPTSITHLTNAAPNAFRDDPPIDVGSINTVVVDPIDPAVLYAGTGGIVSNVGLMDRPGGVFKSVDSGTSWTSTDAGLEPDVTVYQLLIDPVDTATLYAATSHGVYKSSDASARWNRVLYDHPRLRYRLEIDPTNTSVLYASTGRSRLNTQAPDTPALLKSVDSGLSWAPVDTNLQPNISVDVLAVAPDAPGVVYARMVTPPQTRDPRSVLWTFNRSDDGGMTWRRVPDVPANIVTSLVFAPSNPAILYLWSGVDRLTTTEPSGPYKSIDGGQTWQPLARPAGILPQDTVHIAVAASDPDVVYIAGGSSLYRSVDGGESWERYGPGLPLAVVTALAVHPSNAACLYAGTEDGGLWTRNSTVDPWYPTGLIRTEIRALVADPVRPGVLYAAGGSSGVFKSADSGATWRRVELSVRTFARSLFTAPTDPPTVYSLANFRIFKGTGDAEPWQLVDVYEDTLLVWSFAVDPRMPDMLYAQIVVGSPSNYNYHLVTSSNSGKSWEVLSPGIVLDAIVIGPFESSTVYGHNGAGILKSTDGGRTWANPQVPDNPRIRGVASLLVDPHSSSVLYAGSGVSGVLKSTDGGVTWAAMNAGLPVAPGSAREPSPSVRSLVLAPSDPSVLYAVVMTDRPASGFDDLSRYGVFASRDGGESWTATSLDGMPISALIVDPTDARTVYAATNGQGLYRSTDGGATWSRFYLIPPMIEHRP